MSELRIGLATRACGVNPSEQPTRGLRVQSLPEPNVEFNYRRESANIREGITQFGAYDNEPTMIEVVPICTPALRNNMAELIERIKTGKYKYRGSERTFSTRFTIRRLLMFPHLNKV